MSTHEVLVVQINKIEPHPNADSLGLVRIDGFTNVVRLDSFKVGDLAIYIEPDYIVPDTEEYQFLNGHLRIKSRRFRGVWSQGLLMPAPAGAKEGECVMKRLGITYYEPPLPHLFTRGENEKLHPCLRQIPTYGLENWRKHQDELVIGEPVIITEKIHGANARYTFRDGRMWAGSHTCWKKPGEHKLYQRILMAIRRILIGIMPFVRKWWRPLPHLRTGNIWWRVLHENPWIEEFCRSVPKAVLYGEIYGDVQDLKYDAPRGMVSFLAFDLLISELNGTQRWLDAEQFLTTLTALRRVPTIHVGYYNPLAMEEMSRIPLSALGDNIGEGIVIKPFKERRNRQGQRVAFKLVSDLYLERG